MNTHIKVARYSVFALFLMLASTGSANTIDSTSVKTITLNVSGNVDNIIASPTDQNALVDQIKANLNSWNIPLTVEKNDLAYSHSLTAEIGAIEYGSTPVGLSFSTGNSDPRAKDFQKAHVLPITCRIQAKAHPEQHAELTQTVSANNKPNLASLADDISSICFQLLDDLKITKLTPQTPESIKTVTWMPKLRVETIPAAPLSTKPLANGAVAEEEKKQIILHNQGTPVIFKWGQERR
ncbi:hypothetical protein [Methylocucumis oryzae]|uniref:hypothetical protein n=1 Tax=Methylocucumis oryzae TaxID=1632867 RepID=UPI0006985BC9|nr:hypothetical protein [Methylocucumis oryzae]